MNARTQLPFFLLLMVLGVFGCSSFQSGPISHESASLVVDAPMRSSYQGRRDLYVVDYGVAKITLYKNGTFTPDGTITNGLNGPQGATLDQFGNLFVANRTGGNIAEYAPGASSPSFLYSAGTISPLEVSVNRQGDVFATDVPEPKGNDTVVEYGPGVNRLLHRCIVSGIFSVATDTHGNVFVAYNLSANGPARIAEYKGGLAGCSPTVLSASVAYAGGMLLDNQNDIIIADGNRTRVDVIPPPYSKIARTFGHLNTPVFLSIDRSNKELFVQSAGFFHSYIYVVDYPSGKTLHQLGPRYNIGDPYGVVDGPNEVL